MTWAASIRTSSCAARACASSVNNGLPTQSMSLQPTLSIQNRCIDLSGSGTHIAINVSFCAKASLAVGLPMTEFFALFKNARSTPGIVMMGVIYTESSNCPLQGRVYTDTVRGLEAKAGTCRGRARMVVALRKAR